MKPSSPMATCSVLPFQLGFQQGCFMAASLHASLETGARNPSGHLKLLPQNSTDMKLVTQIFLTAGDNGNVLISQFKLEIGY